MVKFKVPLKDILGRAYYQYELTSSNYNPKIDSTITVTVTVKDVYDDPVENESVQVTCNIGKFTKLNGSTISDTQSVTAQTDSNGEISLTYSCSEWGLVTFSANKTSTQVNVTGWKQVQSLNGGRVLVDTDGKNAKIIVSGIFVTSTSEGEFTLATIDSAYRPTENYSTNYSAKVAKYQPVYILSNGTVVKIHKTSTSSSDTGVYCTLFYPLKTPLY